MPQLDQNIINMAKAIRDHESGGNFNAKGASGEYGAYQFMPKTWSSWAGNYLGDSKAQMTPENQNKVAYYKIKDLKDQGYNPAQIASIWNSGSPNWQGKVGTNSQGVHYDTPQYVQKVYQSYQYYKSGGQQGSQTYGGTTSTPQGAQFPQGAQQAQTAGPVADMTDQPPQEAKPSVGGFLGNILSSGANLIGGIGSALLHPINTVKNLGKVVIGAGEDVAGKLGVQNFGNMDYRQNANAVGRFFKQRYGGLSNIGNTLYKDPVGALADASTLLTGVGGGIGALSKLGEAGDIAKLGEASNLAKAGELATRAGGAIDPINALIRGKNLAANIISPRLVTKAEELYQGAAKPTQAFLSKNPDVIRNALEEKIPIGEKGIAKAQNTIGDINQQIDTHIQNASNASYANNKNISPDLQPLAQEARKYKSAEDFVKAQINAYHGSKESISQFVPEKMTTIPIYENGEKIADSPVTFFAEKEGHAQTFGKITTPVNVSGKGIVFDAGGQTWEGIFGGINKAYKDGADYVEIRNIVDMNSPTSKFNKPETIFAVLKNDAIKTKSQLTDFYNQATKKSKPTIKSSDVIKRLQETKQQFGTDVAPQASLARLNKLAKQFKEAHGTELTPEIAQQIKKGTYKFLSKNYGKLGSASIEGRKALARGLKEEIQTLVPEVGDLNARESKLIGIEQMLKKTQMRTANHNPIGLGDIGTGIAGTIATGGHPLGAIAGVGYHVIMEPAIRSRLAIALYQMAKRTNRPVLGLMNPSRATILNRLNEIAARGNVAQASPQLGYQ